MMNLRTTNGKPCTEDQIQWMIETAVEATKLEGNNGHARCTMGNTLISAYTTYDGSIEVEVTERKRYTVIKPTAEAQKAYEAFEDKVEEAQCELALEGATCPLN